MPDQFFSPRSIANLAMKHDEEQSCLYFYFLSIFRFLCLCFH